MKRHSLVILPLLLVMMSLSANAEVSGKVKTHFLITDKITTGVVAAVQPMCANRSFHSFGNVSASTGSATINIEVSNDGTNFVSVDTQSLTLGTTVTSDTFWLNAPFKYVRGNVTAISGTNAKVSLIMGCQL